MPKLTNPSVVEWSILRGVSGFLWSNAIKDGCMTVAVFPLINILHVSSSDDKYATLKIFLHSVCIGPFILREGLTVCGEGQSLR